jgi:hypothetical protein
VGIIVGLLIYFKEFSNKKPPTAAVSTFNQKGTLTSRAVTRDETFNRPLGQPAKWYSKGKSVTVQRSVISDGMVYVGSYFKGSYGNYSDACLIDPTLRVSYEGFGEPLGYWPNYSDITKRCRGVYLRWIAGGRRDPGIDIGYVFIFFYGLERRLFVDGRINKLDNTERIAITDEVIRLLSVYGDNWSFRGYASRLLGTEWLLFGQGTPLPAYIDFDDYHFMDVFRAVLGRYVTEGKPIPAGIALQWLNLYTDYRLKTPARRCKKEFRELFVQEYAERYGEGLVIPRNKRGLFLDYHPASPTIGRFNLELGELSDPFLLMKPKRKLIALAEKCTGELDAYSRFMGKKGSDPNSLTALAYLPKGLLDSNPIAGQAKAGLSEICEEGTSVISTEDLFSILGFPLPAEINKKYSHVLALLLEKLGFGIAPDTRYHNGKLDIPGEIAIFKNGHGPGFIPSRGFNTIGAVLQLGALVSQTTKGFLPAKEGLLRDLVQSDRELNTTEKDSLLAYLYWCIRTPQKKAGLKNKLARLTVNEKLGIGRVLLSVALADGSIEPKEVKKLETLYGLLGLDKTHVISDLASTLDEPVKVSDRDPEITYQIPKVTVKPRTGLELNEDLIRLREEETRRVKTVLEGIFSAEGADDNKPEPSTNDYESTVNPLNALDSAHVDLFKQLVEREFWDRDALEGICEKYGLMTDGAMEVLNEWAFEYGNAPLIIDGKPIHIDTELAEEICGGLE